MRKLIALSLWTVPACVEFDPGSLITETRVLGAQVQVEGDPERSTPRPGETAHVEFVIAGVELDPRVAWSLSACLPGERSADACTDVLASAEGTGTTPGLRIAIPAESALGRVRFMRVVGLICTRGSVDVVNARCVGDHADGTPLRYDLALAREADGSDENLQPSIQQVRLRFDGEEWRGRSALAQGCAGQPELPKVIADEREHRITIELGPDTRELYVGADERASYEELQLSTFVTGGELERQFSFVEPSDTRERPVVQIEWTAPSRKQLHGADELGVRLLVLVRDSRGGLSQVERALCVVRTASGHLSARTLPDAPDSRPT
jgi:hypothetical protein